MTNTKTMKNKFTILFLITAAFIACKKEAANEDLTHYLTKDSIQYFDVYGADNGFKKPVTTFSFDTKGKNERFTFTRKGKEREILPYFNEPDRNGMTDNWKKVNDSTFTVMGKVACIIERQTEDTLFVKHDNGSKSFFVRVKGDPKITKESLYKRDSIIDDKERKIRISKG
jgi:uncharacterized protein YxeA